MHNRRAPRDKDKEVRPRRRAAFDVKSVRLGSEVAQDQRMPAWVRRHKARAWAPVVGKYARAGWSGDDVYEAIRDYLLSHRLLHEPHNPYGYLAHILSHTDLEAPPAAHMRAQAAAEDALRRSQQAAMRAEFARRDTNAAPAGSHARMQARAIAAAAAQRRTHKRSTW